MIIVQGGASSDVLPAGRHCRLDALPTGGWNTLDVENSERHTGQL
jgi:hypothetical protein